MNAVLKMIKIMPLDHPVLKSAAILQPENRDQYTVTDLMALAAGIKPDINKNGLQLEWLEFAVDDDVLQDAKPEVFWANSEAAYPILSSVMHILMCLPHSNASSERVFSMLRKIHTDGRANLCNETIRSLMSIKINEVACCHGIQFSKPLRSAMKRATRDHNMGYATAAAAAIVDTE